MEHRTLEQLRGEAMVQSVTGATGALGGEGSEAGEGSEIRMHSVSELERLAHGGCWLGVDKVDITPDGAAFAAARGPICSGRALSTSRTSTPGSAWCSASWTC